MPRRTAKRASAPPKTHYEALDLRPSATPYEIKKAFKSISLTSHPDKLIGLALTAAQKEDHKAKFLAANDAYALLMDARKRREYDISLAMKGLNLYGGDRFGNDEPLSREDAEIFANAGMPGYSYSRDSYGSDEEEYDSEENGEDGDEGHSYPRVYQSASAGLTWEDGILIYQHDGWDLQVQIESMFAHIVRAEISPFDGSMDEFQIFVDIQRLRADRSYGTTGRREKAGEGVLSVLMTRTPKLRRVVRVASERVRGPDGVESVYITVELAPTADTAVHGPHVEFELDDLDLDCNIDRHLETGQPEQSRSKGSGNGKSIEYPKLPITKLKDMCRERSLQMSGDKVELVERLREDDAGEKQKGRAKKVEGSRKANSTFVTTSNRTANLRMKSGGGTMGGTMR